MTRPGGLERRIRADLEQAIREGAFKPGERLPTEAELTARYGCSRMTVSKAVSALAAAGLVTRNRRAGTVVARPHIQTAVLEIPDIAAVIAARGEAYEFRLLGRQVRAADPQTPEEAALGEGFRALELDGLHLAGGEAFALEHRILSLDAAPEALEEDFAVQAPGSWLLGHIPWTDARHRITAVAADARAARRLDIPRGSACLQLERWTWKADEEGKAGQGVTFVRQLFPGDRYDLVADFARS